jgi:cytochrome c oxidase subunit 1
MVFFVLTGGLSGTFSNLLIPLQVGARDMASGFLNMHFVSGSSSASVFVMFDSLFIEAGPASGGWTVYPPLSALTASHSRVRFRDDTYGWFQWSLFIASSLLGGINYVVLYQPSY